MRTCLWVIILFACTITQVNAGDFGVSSCDLNIFGVSHHPGGTNGGKLNEKNYGLGLRCNVKSDGYFGFKPVLEADILRNSQRGNAVILGGGFVNNDILRLGPVSFGGGAEIINIRYQNPKIHTTVSTWTPAVFFSASYGDWTLNGAPVPKGKEWLYFVTYRF